MKKKQLFLGILSSIIVSLFLVKGVFAVCPLCTIAVAGGVEVSRVLGVDDLITGVWIGGLIVSMSFWFSDWLTKKNFLKKGWREVLSLMFFYLLTVPFLYWGKLIGVANNTFLGVDKIIFGIVIGSMVFVLAVLTDRFLRQINNNQIFFYYQKVLIPLFFLTITSFVFYQLTQ